MLSFESTEPPGSIFGRIEPPALVLRGVEPPIADDFDGSRQAPPPLACVPCRTRASLEAKRCARRVLGAPDACISLLVRCARRGLLVCLGWALACQVPSLEHFDLFEGCNC